MSTPKVQRPSNEEFYRKTVERIERIQTHLSRSPRGMKLKGKVCIITGVGSLKGIGRATSLLYAHEGMRPFAEFACAWLMHE